MAKDGKRPSKTIQDRLSRCRRAMADAKIDGYLVTNRFDHFYLTGFTGEDSAVLITKKTVYVISDGRFETAISKETPWAKVNLRKGMLEDEIAKVAQKARVSKLHIQADYMPVAFRSSLMSKLSGTGIKLAVAPNIVGDMRELKDAGELKVTVEAVRCAEEAFKATVKTIKVGQTELEMAARLEYEMKRRGSSKPAFDSIVAVDANAALPHAFPGNKKVKKGSLILFDWGATLGFYRSDLTRVVFVGSIPRKIRRVYEVVLEAQLRAIAAIRPGQKMCDVDAVARGYIAEAGFEKEFNHGLGHGLGLDVHEAPSLSWRSSAKLVEGMVVTVEPGIYLPGIGGVRIEDDVVVTATGCKVLSRLKKDLDSAVIAVRGG